MSKHVSAPQVDSSERSGDGSFPIPARMNAGVYRGNGKVRVESVETPSAGRGELLIRVDVCGVCNTDIKKVEKDLLPPPRIYGHETAGTVAAVGEGAKGWSVGDRVVVFHHIPCGECFYCERKLFAQCPTYKKVGVTAGFEAAGGGFAEYVLVRDWIVRRGVVLIPDHVTFEEASFLEPVNTCLKAISRFGIEPGDTVLVMGQGPIGLMLLMLARRITPRVFVSEPYIERRMKSLAFGAVQAFDPMAADVANEMRRVTEGRGADVAIVAAVSPSIVEQALDAVRPGGRVALFAQTSPDEKLSVRGASICVDEKSLIGSYSADVEMQDETARLIFSGELPVAELISHRFGLSKIGEALAMASKPSGDSLKIVVRPEHNQA